MAHEVSTAPIAPIVVTALIAAVVFGFFVANASVSPKSFSMRPGMISSLVATATPMPFMTDC